MVTTMLQPCQNMVKKKRRKKEKNPPHTPLKEKEARKEEDNNNKKHCSRARTREATFGKPAVEEIAAKCRSRNNGLAAEQIYLKLD